ncbi:MAG: TM2 domain-containing protein [Candidatus Fimenecus sp.]
MEQVKAFGFLEEQKDFLFPNKVYSETEVEQALLEAPEAFAEIMKTIPFRKPSTVKLISILVGSLGVDRFYLGDVKKGIIKYFTFGGFGVWWIKDFLSAKDRCRAYNCEKLLAAIQDPSVVAQMQRMDASIDKAVQVAKAAAPLAKDLKDGLGDVRDTFYVN